MPTHLPCPATLTGYGMRDVVVGHGQDWELRDGPVPPPLVDGGQISCPFEGASTWSGKESRGTRSAPIFRTKGGYFGERALIHDEPQEASVRGTSDTLTCFRVAREVFENLMNERIQALRQVKLFKSLNRSEIENAAEALEVVEFEEGEYVLRQHAW